MAGAHDNGGSVADMLRDERSNAAKHGSGKKSRPRVSIACTICRDQHLRCDATLPSCTRCTSLNKRCVYVDIRRRRRRPARQAARRECVASASQPETGHQDLGNIEHEVIRTDADCIEVRGQPHEPDPTFDMNGAGDYLLSPRTLASEGPTDSGFASQCLDGFYTYFFPGHPFVLPKEALLRYAITNPVPELISVMAFIGSLYIQDVRSSRLQEDAEKVLDKDLPSTGFSVQAFLLLALCLEWKGDGDMASNVLERAKSTALELGMNRPTFAMECGHSDSVLEESWRRTWWELYVVDALFAGIRHWPTFSLLNLGMDVPLPAEEEFYIAGVRNVINMVALCQ